MGSLAAAVLPSRAPTAVGAPFPCLLGQLRCLLGRSPRREHHFLASQGGLLGCVLRRESHFPASRSGGATLSGTPCCRNAISWPPGAAAWWGHGGVSRGRGLSGPPAIQRSASWPPALKVCRPLHERYHSESHNNGYYNTIAFKRLSCDIKLGFRHEFHKQK